MTQYKPRVITRKEAKKQVNRFGISLVIYIFLNLLLWYGIGFLRNRYAGFFGNFDPDLIIMVFFIVLNLLAGYVFFRFSAAALDLNIKDYLRKPKISPQRMVMLIACGIAVTYLFTAVGSFFRFLLLPASNQFEFVGHFTTRLNIIKNIVYFILFVLIKPWVEEYAFRGVIQRQLGHYNRYFGVLASSFLYALAQPSLTDAVLAFFSGWYLALITYRYHSIIPARRIHMAVALFTWFIAVLPDRFVIIPTVLIAAAYLIAGYTLIGQKIDFHITRSGAMNPKLWKTVLTSFTVIISILLFITGCVLSFII